MSDGQRTAVTKADLLARIRQERTTLDGLVAHVPRNALEVPPLGHEHSPKEIVAHVAAYEELIVERLRAARRGETTSFDRDRVGWEQFNQRIWHEAKQMGAEQVLEHSAATFENLIDEVSKLRDEELTGPNGIAVYVDPAWLNGHTLGELIGVDSYEHYPMHREALEAAAQRPQQ